MSEKRHFSGEQKTLILREYWKEKQSISKIAERYKVSPQLIYKWEKQLFEIAPEILSSKAGRPKDLTNQQKKIDDLSSQVQKKDAIIAHLVNDNLTLKKNLGEI